jgi:hypothetical protein
MTDEELQAIRTVLPDGHPDINGTTVLGHREYCTAVTAAYLRTVRQGVEVMLADLVNDSDPELRAKAAATDAERLAQGLFERDVLPMLEAHFERGEQVFRGASIDH